ncbi:hypothetical protein ACFQX4_16485 [Roseomonas sp. GCM10028921]
MGEAAATLPEISPSPEASADKHEEAASSRPEEALTEPAREAAPSRIAIPPAPRRRDPSLLRPA